MGRLMSQQVKLDPTTKREIELYAALVGKKQNELLAESWEEYKERHRDDFQRGLAWASEILGNPGAVATAASGMSSEDIAEIDAALNG
jgi:hypothetical protein